MPKSNAVLATHSPAVKEVHILWLTAGLGCDGDSVSITAATQPSLEDVVMGAIPGLPKVHLHNPVLAYEVGDAFMNYFYLAERPTRPVCPRCGRFDSQRNDQGRGIPGQRSAPTKQASASRSRPALGSIGSRPRPGPSSPREPARRTVAFMPWRGIQPAAWDWPITSAGTSKPKVVCRSSMCRAVPCNLTTLWKRLLQLLFHAAGPGRHALGPAAG